MQLVKWLQPNHRTRACTPLATPVLTAPSQAPQVYPGPPVNYTTTRATTLSVAAPGLVANTGPLQAFIGTRMTASLVSGPSSGSLTVFPSGAFNYTPARTFVGVDSFVVWAQRDCSGSTLTSPQAVIYVNGAWGEGRCRSQVAVLAGVHSK